MQPLGRPPSAGRSAEPKHTSPSRTLWPLVVALVVFAAGTAAMVLLAARGTDGRLVYPLDDPYISMAMGKNLADHGVLGVTPHGFTAAASSIAWPLLIALGDLAVPARDLVPLAWNLLFAAGILGVAHAILRARGVPPRWECGALLAIVVLTPLPLLTFVGLEHGLHTFLTLVAASILSRQLSGPATLLPRWPSPAAAAAVALLVTARYEGLLLVLVACLIAAARRRFGYAITLGLAALVPVAAFGLVSVANGWHLLPNSVLLKGNLAYAFTDLREARVGSTEFLHALARILGIEAYRNAMSAPAFVFLPMVVLVPTLVHPSSGGHRAPGPSAILKALFLGTFLLHAEFALAGNLGRYEAYLVVLAIVVAAAGWDWRGDPLMARTGGSRLNRRAIAGLALLAVPGIMLAERARIASLKGITGSRNIYEQQYQMGLFLREYYPGGPVTANDIGAINYLADIRCFDIIGLASLEPVAAGARARTTQGIVDRWVGGKGIAVVYRRALDARGGPLPAWIEAGTWTIQDNQVAGDPTVTFFAVDPTEAERLVDNLRRFAPRLPPSVVQSSR